MKASCHVIPEGSSFDANETLELTNRWQNSVLFAAPTMVKNLVSAAKEGKENHLRLIIYGGGRCTWRIAKRCNRTIRT